MRKLLRRLFGPKIKHSFAVYYVVQTGDLIELDVARYEVDEIDVALAMHRSDCPRTKVHHVVQYTWEEYA